MISTPRFDCTSTCSAAWTTRPGLTEDAGDLGVAGACGVLQIAGVAQRLLVMRDGQVHERIRPDAEVAASVDPIDRLVDIDDPADLPW